MFCVALICFCLLWICICHNRFAFILILLYKCLTINMFHSYWWWICNKFENFTRSTLSYIDSQFNYAPLIWMFCHKTTYLKMQKIHHKTLKVIYQSDASYDDLLQLSNSVSLHQRHLRFLLTEIYKSTGTLNPQFMWSYFKYREVPYNLRRGPVLFIPPARSTIYGTNSVHFRGSLIWNRLPNLVKSSRSISEFKNVIKKIRNIDCGCRICRR